MLYHLLYPLHHLYGSFRIFRYISFRVFMAILTTLLISFIVGPFFIRLLKKKQTKTSNIREDVPDRHLEKSGTPTMGGLLIIFSLTVSFVLWARFDVYITWAILLCTIVFALIGFLDDYRKIKRSKGINAKTKLALQLGGSFLVSIVLLANGFETNLQVPFLKDFSPQLPIFVFICFSMLVIVGSSNAVNLTDGLDGLAIGPVMVSAFTFLLFAYIASHEQIADYLQVTPVAGVGELVVFCGCVIGAGLGFLWFNTYPAQVFMGDVGSISLGAALGAVAVMVKQELLLLLVGGIFVVETVSVLIQVLSYKTTGKRVFRMAPIHHHFELKGWAEPKVIVRFWIISIILSLLALTTLKLR